MSSESGASAWDIRLQDLKVGYGDVVVLDHVNAYLPAGEISFILGRSGCGKSTLLRHIIGLNRPMAGRIYLGGQDIFELSRRQFRAVRRKMGVLFQDGALLGSMTLAQNVGLPLKEHTRMSKKEIEKTVNEKLALVGLEKVGAYYPSELSGGMRKRAGLARAIVADPPILLCDEPTSGLDPINSAQMDKLLLNMKEKLKVTIVVVSHDLESLSSIADNVVVLHDGGSIFTGGLDSLNSTRDPYLRRFLDRNPELDSAAPAAHPGPDKQPTSIQAG